MQKAHLENYQEIGINVTRNAINWCVVAAAAPAWAAKIFPDLKPKEAEEKLWQAIFETTRAVEPDPVAAWGNMSRICANAQIICRRKNILHYTTNPKTQISPSACRADTNGSARNPWRRTVSSSLPTCRPRKFSHCLTASARMARSTATFPLSYGGSLIEDFQVTFENGKIVKVSAKKNEAILQKLVDTDEGAHPPGRSGAGPCQLPHCQTRTSLLQHALR